MLSEKVMSEVWEIEDLLFEYDCELVSYGLAPNPNGFCFERGEYTTDYQAKEISDKLDSLSKEAVNYLKEHYL